MIVGGAAVPATRNPLTDHYSFVCFSKDGKDWTQAAARAGELALAVAGHLAQGHGLRRRLPLGPKGTADDENTVGRPVQERATA